ncbi:uncharacterized protein METZ01_LOCUS32581 [marine metagenome]|uniref:Uncharacterized protein n=1 Tax=marine metagenome TaxID=408172 RepID=A0A381QP85_9ZZZZ
MQKDYAIQLGSSNFYKYLYLFLLIFIQPKKQNPCKSMTYKDFSSP